MRELSTHRRRRGTPDRMDPAELADLEQRLKLLRAASRPKEPLTDKAGVTVQGHISSAISKLERAITAARMG